MSYSKYKNEYFFSLNNNLTIYFDKNKTLLWSNENMDNVDYQLDTITFKKSKTIYYSNERIFNEFSNFNGLIFKPSNDIKDLTIGFHNIDVNEVEETKLKGLDYGIKLLGDNYLQIMENKEVIDMDYCFDKNIVNCNKTNNKYKYKEGDILGMNIIDSRFNYFIIKNKNTTIYTGIRIHRSKKLVNYPVFACIINDKRRNTINNNVWTTSFITPPPAPWSVEYTSLINYRKRELPLRRSFDREVAVVEAPAPVVIEEEPEIDPFEKVIRILEANLYNNSKLIVKCSLHNISQDYLNKLHQASIRLTLINDDDLKLIIPINDTLVINRQNMLNDIEIDISEYINYFYRKKFYVEVIFRRSRSMSQQFNITSNKFQVN